MNIQGIGSIYTGYQTMQMRGAGGPPGGFNPPDIEASNIMEREDANLDGVITTDESQLSADMFSNADSDEDGQLTTEELEEMLAAKGPPGNSMQGMEGMPDMGGKGPPPPPPPGSGFDVDRILEQEDQDGDGTISMEESSLSDEEFSVIDENQDGIITIDEIEKAKENEPYQMGSMPGGSSGATQPMVQNRQIAIDAYNTAMQSFITGYAGNQQNSQWEDFLSILA